MWLLNKINNLEKKLKKSIFFNWVFESPFQQLFLTFLFVFTFWIIGWIIFCIDKNAGVFDALSALFSGLAFSALLCALKIQHDELFLQREELNKTRLELKETKEATQKQATASMRLLSFYKLQLHEETNNKKITDLNAQKNKIHRILKSGRRDTDYLNALDEERRLCDELETCENEKERIAKDIAKIANDEE